MSRSTLPPPGMDLPRAHRHACGHNCRCTLGAFAGTTICRQCAADRFNARLKTNQDMTKEMLGDQR